MVNIWSRPTFIFCTISFIKSINNNGELGSPCFKPLYELKKKHEVANWYLTQDLTTVYMERKALTNLLLTVSGKIFCHRKDLLILSKAFS